MSANRLDKVLPVERADEWWSQFGRYSMLRDRYRRIEFVLEHVRHQPYEAAMAIAFTPKHNAPRAAEYHQIKARFETTLSSARADLAKAEAMAREMEDIWIVMRKMRERLGLSVDDDGRELIDGVSMTKVLLGEHQL